MGRRGCSEGSAPHAFPTALDPKLTVHPDPFNTVHVCGIRAEQGPWKNGTHQRPLRLPSGSLANASTLVPLVQIPIGGPGRARVLLPSATLPAALGSKAMIPHESALEVVAGTGHLLPQDPTPVFAHLL